MDGEGTYTLVVSLRDATCVTFGAAGERALPAGTYAYVGTALGPGGFSRVERHRELARGERETRHWHVDYLLGQSASRVESVVTSADVDAECAIATTLGAHVDSVAGLGASDCDCETHLFGPAEAAVLTEAIETAHDVVRREH